MKKKLALSSLVIIAILAFASMGISYSGEDFIDFVGVGYKDNDDTTKNIGSVTAYIVDPTNLSISIIDAYPGYKAYVNFTLKHTGSSEDPIEYLDNIIIDNGNETLMSVVVTDRTSGLPFPADTYLKPGETLEGLITISMFDEPAMDHTYSFY